VMLLQRDLQIVGLTPLKSCSILSSDVHSSLQERSSGRETWSALVLLSWANHTLALPHPQSDKINYPGLQPQPLCPPPIPLLINAYPPDYPPPFRGPFSAMAGQSCQRVQCVQSGQSLPRPSLTQCLGMLDCIFSYLV